MSRKSNRAECSKKKVGMGNTQSNQISRVEIFATIHEMGAWHACSGKPCNTQ